MRELGNGIEAHRSIATALYYAFLRHHDSSQDAVLFTLAEQLLHTALGEAVSTSSSQ